MRIFLKLFKESVLFALHALRVNKLRTFLSLLGISIGIFAIISVFTVVDAMQENVEEGVSSLGDNVVYIQKWPWAFGPDYPWWKYYQRPVPSVQEMEQLMERANSVESFSFEAYIGGKTVKYKNNVVENADIAIASHDYYKTKSFDVSAGRYFTEMESKSGRAMAVIGADIAASLFPNEDPVDKQIKIQGRKIDVIGVFKKEGKSLLDISSDNIVLIPVNFARNIIDLRSDRIDPFIKARSKPGISNAEMMDELKGLMRSIRRLRPIEDDNFALNETKLLSNQISGLFSFLTLAGWIIGGFSILVGGFGIANIMFVSVKERTNQIGIQKSLGAKNYFILLQFLVEAIVLCLIGGAMGLLVVFFLTFFGSSLLGFNITLTFGNIFLGLFVSALIGIISGFVPAYSASRLDPVEAIRSGY